MPAFTRARAFLLMTAPCVRSLQTAQLKKEITFDSQ